MEKYLNENFTVKPKHSSKEELKQWREVNGVIRNRKRRFRYTADLPKRDKAAAMRRINQKNFLIAHLISKAAIQFHLDISLASHLQGDANESKPTLPVHHGSGFAVLLLLLEGTSFVFDQFGKSKWSFLLAGFLISAFGFVITIYTRINERKGTAATGLPAERQLGVMDIAFSTVQLFSTFIHFILPTLGVKNNFNASVLPLVFAIIVVIFAYKKDGKVAAASSHNKHYLSLPGSFPVTKSPQDAHSVPITHNFEQIEIIVDDVNRTSDQLSTGTSPISQTVPTNCKVDQYDPSENIEVCMPITGVQRSIYLTMFTCFEDLCKKVWETMVSLQGELQGQEHTRKSMLVDIDPDKGVYLLVISN